MRLLDDEIVRSNLGNVSICTSMYNEEENLEELFANFLEVRRYFDFKFPIIIVDNGSTDSSMDLARIKCSKMDLVTTVFNRGNGWGDGIRSALKRCETDYALITSSDLQYNVEDWCKLIEVFINSGTNISPFCVFSRRKFRFDSFYESLRGKLWRKFLVFILRLPRQFDPASQLKLVNVNHALKATSHDFIWDIENVVQAINHDLAIRVVEISFWPRKYGSSSLRKGFLRTEIHAMRRLLHFIQK